MRALVLWANNDSGNLGVRALAEGNRSLIERAFGEAVECELQDFGVGPSGVSFGAKSVLRDILHTDRAMRAKIQGFDVVIDTGAGDSFTDHYGLKRLAIMTYVARLARKVRVPVVLSPQTIGPFNSRFGKLAGRRTLRTASLVLARDSVSARIANEMGTDHAALATDVVFLLPQPDQQTAHDVIVNVSGLLWYENGHVPHESYRMWLLELIANLGSQGRDVALMAHVVEPKNAPRSSEPRDADAIQELNSQLAAPLETIVPTSLTEAREHLAGANVVIGSRMHCCLNALSVGTPSVAWAYSRKFLPLTGDLGWTHGVDLRTGANPVPATLETLRVLDSDDGSVDINKLRAAVEPRIETAIGQMRAVLLENSPR